MSQHQSSVFIKISSLLDARMAILVPDSSYAFGSAFPAMGLSGERGFASQCPDMGGTREEIEMERQKGKKAMSLSRRHIKGSC